LTIEHNKLTDFKHLGYAFSGEAGNDQEVVDAVSTHMKIAKSFKLMDSMMGII